MITRDQFLEILCKYPELIDQGYKCHGRDVDLYGLKADMLLVDKYKKRLAVHVRTAPIEQEQIGAIVSCQEAVLSDEAGDINVMLVSDKVPVHLQTALEHSGVAWREINHFQIKELLTKKNDTELLKTIL